MNRVEASSLSELLKALSDVQDDVPPRGIGRRTEHTEPWVLKRLTASLASADFLKFPLTVKLADRPDIALGRADQIILASSPTDRLSKSM